jgi:tRNA U34 5-methylaminomethyl-2-thiouridine-forming methyltransferase MnmC
MAAETALEASHILQIDALEMDRRTVGLTAEKMEPHPDNNLNWNQILSALYNDGVSQPDSNIEIKMHWGEARYRIQSLPAAHYDLVFLDAFSSSRNSELWSVEFFNQIKRILKPSGSLFTYAAAGPIRSGLMQAGFYVGETAPIALPRSGTQASLEESQLEKPISAAEIDALRTTTRGIPFHDPHSVWTHRHIIRDRENRVLAHKK